MATSMALEPSWPPLWHGSATGFHSYQQFHRPLEKRLTIFSENGVPPMATNKALEPSWPPLWHGSATGYHAYQHFHWSLKKKLTGLFESGVPQWPPTWDFRQSKRDLLRVACPYGHPHGRGALLAPTMAWECHWLPFLSASP